eukprot:3609481-Pyramimonas_sp.AAC.1
MPHCLQVKLLSTVLVVAGSPTSCRITSSSMRSTTTTTVTWTSNHLQVKYLRPLTCCNSSVFQRIYKRAGSGCAPTS